MKRDLTFTAATLNTQYSNAFQNPEVFDGTDIVTLQEVLHPEKRRVDIETSLGKAGLKLSSIDHEVGIAIATSDRFRLIHEKRYVIQQASKLSMLPIVGNRFRSRGLLVAQLADHDDNRITVATSHPIVPIRAVSRRRQMREISSILQDSYSNGPLIYSADNNHYPEPNRVDQALAGDNALSFSTDTDPTCLLENTRHKWLKLIPGIENPRLDSMMFRGLTEHSSETFEARSDHKGIRTQFSFE